jgi:hypothetical protein
MLKRLKKPHKRSIEKVQVGIKNYRDISFNVRKIVHLLP